MQKLAEQVLWDHMSCESICHVSHCVFKLFFRGKQSRSQNGTRIFWKHQGVTEQWSIKIQVLRVILKNRPSAMSFTFIQPPDNLFLGSMKQRVLWQHAFWLLPTWLNEDIQKERKTEPQKTKEPPPPHTN